MVHEKYIKRGNKVFGPYLYQNYRENGKTKTKYLGKSNKGEKKKKLWVNKKIFGFFVVFLIILSLSFLIFSLIGKNIIEFGELGSKLPTERFDVFVGVIPETPPEILIDDEILVCENVALSHFFNISDAGGVESLSVSMVRLNPFFVSCDLFKYTNIAECEIWSDRLRKRDIKNPVNPNAIIGESWATYPETIAATDGMFVDSVQTDIIIIEVNNPPEFDIGVQTIWTRGEDTEFYYDLGSFLEARGEETPIEELVFNLTYSNFSISPFNINGGVINITGNESLIPVGEISKVYNLKVCVNDTGLEEAHPNISFCLLNGQSAEPLGFCDDFSLTITKENRAPEIIAYYPENLSFSVRGTEILYFNITVHDPDLTIPDVYWYVDGVFEEYDKNNSFAEFQHSFGCGVTGLHNITVEATDGLLNDSLFWNLSIGYVACPSPGQSGTGGGAGGGLYCEEKWACEEWQQCRNLKQASEFGEVSKEHKLLIEERCELFNYTKDVCGFQLRKCFDIQKCGTNSSMPGIIKECYYTEEPNCTDGIKNCHHGACEVLVDCGGPCVACPTCSDGIQNQDEKGVDCGGPCEPCKEFPLKPVLFKSIVMYSLIALLIIVAFLVIKQILKYKRFKKIAEKSEKRTKYSVFIFFLVVSLLLFFANIYIMGMAEGGKISIKSMDFLASYNLVSSFVNTLRLFFISGVLINANSKLVIWDATEIYLPNKDKFTICGEYCVEKEKPSASLWTIKFYANYTDLNDNPLNPPSANCEIRFKDYLGGYGKWDSMSYNPISELWEYETSFNYKGNYDFEVNCTYEAISNEGKDDFIIINTKPYILQTGEGYIDFDKNGYKDILECREDSVCYYNFSTNVSEDDINDVLIFSASPVPPNPLTDFFINETTGILQINVTHSSFSGSGKVVELSVRDSESLESALLEVDVLENNDAPIFVNLENKTFNVDDLFTYTINVEDEENNVPFKFNISFLSCSDEAGRGNCSLFTKDDYIVDKRGGSIDISFTPVENDIGSYIINFSVMDNSTLGSKITSKIVNFTVSRAIWLDLALEHFLIEDEEFYLNLSENVTREANFSYTNGFVSFNLTADGIINFTPVDEDVGFYEVGIVASDAQTSSPKLFNFTIENINDIFVIQKPLQANQAEVDVNSNIDAFENANIEIFLFVDDDDFLITQKNFYDESLELNLTIEGPNTTLFEFVLNSISGNRASYVANFIPRDAEVGDYEIWLNITDQSNYSEILQFNLTIFNRDYDVPVIHYPDSLYEFELEENVSSDLVFKANHTVGDNLTYRFYINDELRYSLDYYGDYRNLTWNFTPNFTDETYGEKGNLTLVVLNPFFPELNSSRTWNLTIGHTNAPVEFIRDIGNKVLPYTYTLEIDLREHFFDVDHEDSHYLQNLSFFISSNLSNLSRIVMGPVSENWTFILSSSVYAPYFEVLNITANDLNETNGVSNMTSVVSNNFIVEFIPPQTVTVPTPTGGSSATVPISLKLITPGSVSVYEYETVRIPLRLVNTGRMSFSDLNLESIAFKDGDIAEDVVTSLDKIHFDRLGARQEENLTLTVFLGTNKVGYYEVLVNVTSKSPKYTDWGKIHINLEKINQSDVMELILFTEEFIVGNPECIEIREVLDEAKVYFDKGDFVAARDKTKQAIEACEESISQPATPKKRNKFFTWGLYFVLAIVAAFIIGVLYYFIKRRSLQTENFDNV